MHLLFLFVTLLPRLCLALEPITTTLGVIGGLSSSVGYLYYNHLKCYLDECCSKPWIHESPLLDFSDLYGQPVAVDYIGEILKRRHLVSKPVVLSLHGPTGTGKSYLSSMIARMIYLNGNTSSYAHYFTVSYHFPNQNKEMEYYNFLINTITNNLKKCEKSMFVFEEFEDMPPKVLSAIASFLDTKRPINGVNTGQALFIFLSNTGQDAIISKTYELQRKGVHRNDFRLKDFESDIKYSVQTEEGAYKNSLLVEKDLIDAYVPFLPMEEKYIRQCVEDEFWKIHRRKVTPEEVDEIVKDVPFTNIEDYFYARSGCRKVGTLVLSY